MSDQTTLWQSLEAATKGEPKNVWFEFILQLYEKYKEYLDHEGKFLTEFQSKCFWERYWELCLCGVIKEFNRDSKISPFPHNHGPDFRVTIGGFSFLLEAVCPNNANRLADMVPEHQPWNPKNGGKPQAHSYCPEKIQLRISNLILSTKKEQYNAWLDKGIVNAEMPFVLAIGLYALPREETSFFMEIPTNFLGGFFGSQFPLYYILDSKIVSGDALNKPNSTFSEFNVKSNGSDVSRLLFLDPCNSYISAVLLSSSCDPSDEIYNIFEYSKIDPFYKMQRDSYKPSLKNDLILIHNPYARNPLKRNLIATMAEYIADISGESVSVKKI